VNVTPFRQPLLRFTDRKTALLLLPIEQRARRILGLLHLRLVERVDVEHRAGNRGRDLPADELGAKRQPIRQIDPQNRRDRVQRAHRAVLLGRGLAEHVDLDERAIGSVRLRETERLAGDRHHADTLFAGALGDELFDPQAEWLERVGQHQRQFVMTGARRGPHQ
jgi:hypothetical protein